MKNIIKLLLLIAINICFASVNLLAADNCIANSSFEKAPTDNRDITDTDWFHRDWGGRAKYAHAKIGHTGLHSLSLDSTTGTVDACWTMYKIVKPFTTYKLTCWIKTENVVATSGQGALVSLNRTGYRTQAVTGSTDWTEVDLQFKTESKDSIQINLMLGYYGHATGKVWFDDISLVALKTKEMKPQVEVDASLLGTNISPYIYGQFIEHLGRCIYGGIWAEMLQDRKFYYNIQDHMSPWRIIGEKANVKMNSKSPFVGSQDPKITTSQKGQETGIMQGNLGVEKGQNYVGRIILKGNPDMAPVSVTLAWGDKPEQKQTIKIKKIRQQFKKYPLKFKALENSDNARLIITSSGLGSLEIGTLSLMPANNIQGFRADTLALLKELNAPVYRWPGGNFVSGYDWQDGIGPRDKRPPRKNPAWRGVEHNDVGIHEFIDLCRLIDTEAYIAVNTGLGSAESAANEVEYVNGAKDTPMGKLRKQNGSAKPFKVKWWGVGNEMFGGWQLGHMPIEEYVKKSNEVSKKMWAKDPSIKLVAVGAVGKWDEMTMKYCADYMNYISEHFYCNGQYGTFGHIRDIPNNIKRICDAHRKYRKEIPELKGKDIRIAMDEWNYWYGETPYGELGTRYFLKDALGIAAGLHEYYRNSDIVYMANYAQTVNVIGCIKTTKTKAAFATTGLILKMYRQHFGVTPISIKGDFMPLDVVAAFSKNRKKITISVVNPMSVPITFPIKLNDVKVKNKGKLWIVEGSDPKAYNEPGKEPLVKIEERKFKNWSEELTVPPLSASIYELTVD